MATYYSTQYAKLLNVGRDGVQLAAVEDGGIVRCKVFRFVLTAALVVGDVIKLTNIPTGCLLLMALITEENSLGTVNINVNIGTNTDATVFGNQTLSGNGAFPLGQVVDAYTTTAEETFQMVVTSVEGGAGGSAGTVLRGYVLYSSP